MSDSPSTTDDPSAAPPARRRLAAWVLLAVGILVLPVGIMVGVVSAFHRFAPPPEDTPSTRRLHQIGDALRRYADAHAGAYPPSLEALVAAEHLPADLPVCPTPAPGGPYRYRYVADGLNVRMATNGTVLVYEDERTQPDRGSHVLYADGTDAWVIAPALPDELSHGRPPQDPDAAARPRP